MSQSFNVQPNTEYILSWYGRRGTTNAGIVKITNGAPAYSVVVTDTPVATVSNRWQGREYRFNSGNNSRLEFHFNGDTGTYYIDDIVVIPYVEEDAAESFSEATINGLPNGVYSVTRTSPDENFEEIDSFVVTDETAVLNILNNSVTLISSIELAVNKKAIIEQYIKECGPVAQAAINTEQQAVAYIKGLINSLDLDVDNVTVNGVAFEPAVRGSSGSPAGVNGAFVFNVTFDNGGKSETTGNLNIIITASEYIGAEATAFVTKLTGNQNDLTITVTEFFADGLIAAPLKQTFRINNNAAGFYSLGGYRVYVNTKGNDKIFDCYIV